MICLQINTMNIESGKSLSKRWGTWVLSTYLSRINMRLRQQDLADMVGATRESVNKMLKTYKQKSLIRVQRGFITIMDKEGLLLRAR